MNLSAFLDAYNLTFDRGNAPSPKSLPEFIDSDFVDCINFLGGKSFNDGLYRIYKWDELIHVTEKVTRLFVQSRGKILAFSSDWAGRQFVLDSKETINGNCSVSCYEMHVPSKFCTDMNIGDFHNRALVESRDDALGYQFYKSWKSANVNPIDYDKCVGFRVPLFLGGQETLENLSLTDMDVYLTLCGDLYAAVKNLPAGATIDHILLKIKENAT